MDERRIRSFEDLECWQAARDLRTFVAQVVLPKLPRDEKYRLGDQILRAARSGSANIAEGYGRFHFLDASKFLSNAQGSVYEVQDHLITANDEGLIPEELLHDGKRKVLSAVRLINGYTRYLKRRAETS